MFGVEDLDLPKTAAEVADFPTWYDPRLTHALTPFYVISFQSFF